MPYPTKTNPEAILETALEILELGGSEALSMRSLAERLSIKAPSLYRHYSDKEALEKAMVLAGATRLHQAMTQAAGSLQASAAVFAASQAYLVFARQNPALYDLLMTYSKLPQGSAGSGKELWDVVLKLMSSITHNPDDTAAAVALWAFLHGFSVLERSGMFGPSGPKGGFERGLGALLEGLTKN